MCVGGVRVTMADSVAKDQPCWLVGGHSFLLTCVLSVDMHTHLQFTPAQSLLCSVQRFKSDRLMFLWI